MLTCAKLLRFNFEDLSQVVQCFLVLEQHGGKEVFDIVNFAVWLGPSHHPYPQTVKLVIHQCETVPKSCVVIKLNLRLNKVRVGKITVREKDFTAFLNALAPSIRTKVSFVDMWLPPTCVIDIFEML